MIKHLLKACIMLIVAAVFSLGAQAQIKRPHLYFGAHLLYANPQPAFSSSYKFGVGGELSGGVGVSKTYLVATVGMSAFFANSKDLNGTLTEKPVKIGVKHYLLANKIFINGDLGIASLKDKTLNTAEGHFMRGIGAGVHLLGFEAGLYYHGWKSLHTDGYSNSVMIKVGWGKIF